MYKNINYFSILDNEEDDIYFGLTYPRIRFNKGKLCEYYDDLKDFEKNIKDYEEVQIFVKIYIGPKKEPFQLLFDTGSDTLWV